MVVVAADEDFVEKLKAFIMDMRTVPNLNGPYVSRDTLLAEIDWLEKDFGPVPCNGCGHPKHGNTECGAVTGYDHLNGDHECGCMGELRCDFDCDQCVSEDDEPFMLVEDWSLDGKPTLRPGIVKSHICTCLAGDINYCEVHDT